MGDLSLGNTIMKSYQGIVKHGSKRAAALGYPTINIPLEDRNLTGIYAAKVKVGGKEYLAAAFADTTRKVLEAHLLDFSGMLYGKSIEIELLQNIRETKTFSDDTALRAAIADDVKRVQAYFKK